MKKQVLLYPVVTEKSSVLQGEKNQYVFAVDPSANKFEIKSAVEALKKNLEVKDVRTQVVRGKVKRMGMDYGKRSNWKKAVVTLKEGQSLDLVESA